MAASLSLSFPDQISLLDKLQLFRVQGRDKRGNKVLRVIGKYLPGKVNSAFGNQILTLFLQFTDLKLFCSVLQNFIFLGYVANSARMVSCEAVKKHLEDSVFPKLGEKPFSVVYFHAGVQRGENFPGISALRSFYDAVPDPLKENLQAVYFVHPGLQARIFLGTFGRFIFTGGLYGKVKYVSRLEFMWEYVRKGEMEVPEFVKDHEEELEYRPLTTLDYGMESDFPRPYCAGANMDNPMALYSMRCIS
ncbi:unnamed protein product [Linum tenue]|uniref:CRAL-TRIO domain-containing protein n=1 Tax=Linum tenue TaxID=586396 RepID=A0AAV0LNI4_9ROSI|nr:unnamed protein product [Linum tenue]